MKKWKETAFCLIFAPKFEASLELNGGRPRWPRGATRERIHSLVLFLFGSAAGKKKYWCHQLHIRALTPDLIVWTLTLIQRFLNPRAQWRSWLMDVFKLLVYHKFNDSVCSCKAAIHHVYYSCHFLLILPIASTFNPWLLIVMLWKVMAIVKLGMMSHIKRCYHKPHEPHVHKLELMSRLSRSNIWVFQLISGSMLIPANCKSISAVLHCKWGDELTGWGDFTSSVNQWLITCLLTTWTLQGKPAYEGHAGSR